MALLGGYGSLLIGGESAGEGKVPKAIDDGEEQMLKTSKDKLEEEEKKSQRPESATEPRLRLMNLFDVLPCRSRKPTM